MKKLMMLAALAAGLFAQTTANLTYVAPPPVQGFGGGISGTAGTAYACYWVVVNYVGGGVQSASPVCFANIPNTLSSSNYVALNWQAAAGVNVTYDVLKTTTNVPPAAGASVSLATGLTTTSTSDQGGGLSAYTINAYPYSTGAAFIRLNNRDYTVPAFECPGTSSNPCRFAADFIVPKAGGPLLNGSPTVRLGSQTTPYTIDATGAPMVTQGSATPGAAVGTVTAGGLMAVSANLTLAQVNTGTVILPAVTGQTYKVSHFLLKGIGSDVAGCTSVNIDDTAGTPLVVAAVAVAALASNAVVNEATASGVTLTTFAPTAATASKGLQVIKVGSACTTATSFNVTVFFTINS